MNDLQGCLGEPAISWNAELAAESHGHLRHNFGRIIDDRAHLIPRSLHISEDLLLRNSCVDVRNALVARRQKRARATSEPTTDAGYTTAGASLTLKHSISFLRLRGSPYMAS
jgi:hypothetical protein